MCSSHDEVKTSQKQASSVSDTVNDETSQALSRIDGDNKPMVTEEEKEVHLKESFSKTMNVT
jgi:hypothetical protein